MHDPSRTNQEPIEKNSVLKQKIVVGTDSVLNRVILIISILTGIGLIATLLFYQRKMDSSLIVLALLMTMIVTKLLMKRGQVRLASICAVSGIWSIFAFMILMGGGLKNVNIVFFISTTVWAGLLLGERATIWVAGIGIVMGFGLALMDIFGYLPSRYFLSSPLSDWAQLVFALVLTANTLNLALRDRDNALNMANEQLADRLEAENELRKGEELYTRLVDTIPDAIIRMDLEGKILFVNDNTLTLGGYNWDEIEGQNMLQFIDPEDRDRLIQNAILMMEGRLGPKEYRIIIKDGTKIPLEVNGDVLRSGDGTPFGLVFVCRNISERKRAEEAAKKSEEMLRLITENMSDLIRVADLQGNNLYVSPSHFKSLGYGMEERLSNSGLDIAHPDDIEMIRNKFSEGRLSNQPVRVEYRIRHADGHYVWLDTLADLLRDAQGEPTSVVMSSRDISDRKRLEEERQNLEERLNRAEKMEALGQLAGGVAHDLNNVLGVLTGYSELLLMEIPEGQRARSHVEKILQSTEKGASIIQDLLTLARRGVTVSKVINLSCVVSDFLKTPAFEKMKDFNPRVTFRTECEPNLLNIKGSPVHLEKTLMNLISNATEAIAGKGEVTIRTQSRYLDKAIMGYDEVKEGDYAVLTVSDTGMGIPAEHIEKIFEPFYTKKTMGRSGTGLGLAIVWGTVKDHRGYIDVHTKVGEGTTFTLYFPVTREELATPQQKVPIELYMGKGESVLVVDDIAEQRDVASGLLTRLGYQVHAVSGGEDAVAYLKSHQADILVLDMIMTPGIDGLETYQRVLRVNPKQKAIIVSGFSETDQVWDAQQMGAGAYVKKPYVMEKIGMAIRDELSR